MHLLQHLVEVDGVGGHFFLLLPSAVTGLQHFLDGVSNTGAKSFVAVTGFLGGMMFAVQSSLLDINFLRFQNTTKLFGVKAVKWFDFKCDQRELT